MKNLRIMNAGTSDCDLDHYVVNTTNNVKSNYEWIMWFLPYMKFIFKEVK